MVLHNIILCYKIALLRINEYEHIGKNRSTNTTGLHLGDGQGWHLLSLGAQLPPLRF